MRFRASPPCDKRHVAPSAKVSGERNAGARTVGSRRSSHSMMAVAGVGVIARR